MKYTIEEALEYSKNNKIDEWIQKFLRDSSYEYASPNIALADGLLLEERFYIGPIKINLDKITTKRVEDNLTGNELKYYEEVRDRIAKDLKNSNIPPFIIEYKNKKLYLTDGNHRYSALRKLDIKEYYVIIWGNKDKMEDALEFVQ